MDSSDNGEGPSDRARKSRLVNRVETGVGCPLLFFFFKEDGRDRNAPRLPCARRFRRNERDRRFIEPRLTLIVARKVIFVNIPSLADNEKNTHLFAGNL